MTFIPHTVTEGNSHFAGIRNDLTGERYTIVPLGDERSRGFYSLEAANDLSTAHAATANRLGLSSLPHARKV